MKRMINRYDFVRMERQEGEADAELQFARIEAAWAAEAAVSSPPPSLQPHDVSERTPLQQETDPGGRQGAPAGHSKIVSASCETAGEGELLGPSSPNSFNKEIVEDHAKYVRMKRQESAEEGMTAAAEFFGAIDQELHKVEEFYKGKYAQLDQVLRDFEARGHMMNSWAVPSGNTLTPFFEAYSEITALGAFSEMNGEGFRKIVKKYDKAMGTDFLTSFLERLRRHEFYQSKGPDSLLERLQGLVSRDKLLDMKRHAELAHMDSSQNEIFTAVKFTPLVVSLLLFFFMWMFQPDLDGNLHASRCLTMLVFVTSLWVTEATPYFVTALLIPVLVVLMDIMENSHGEDKKRTSAAHLVLSAMVDHTTILIMGGYAISAAFSRCEIELRIAALLQAHLGGRPRLFILGIMYLGLFLSTLISNHTAPVLCVSILMPIIKDFDVDSKFAKALLLGLAFACNFGAW
ncbi:unnamed protein product [Ectocarpus sp. 12 AP-2014]